MAAPTLCYIFLGDKCLFTPDSAPKTNKRDGSTCVSYLLGLLIGGLKGTRVTEKPTPAWARITESSISRVPCAHCRPHSQAGESLLPAMATASVPLGRSLVNTRLPELPEPDELPCFLQEGMFQLARNCYTTPHNKNIVLAPMSIMLHLRNPDKIK